MPLSTTSRPSSPGAMADRSTLSFDTFMASVTSYKGKSFRWKPPETRRQFLSSIRTLLRFWNRVLAGKIYYKPLIESLRQLAGLYIGFITKHTEHYLPIIFTTSLVSELQGICNWKFPEGFDDLILTKERKHDRRTHCSMCGVALVWPAYLVHQSAENLSVRFQSGPIGIRCVNGHNGKLLDLIVKVKNPENQKALIRKFESAHRPQSRSRRS